MIRNDAYQRFWRCFEEVRNPLAQRMLSAGEPGTDLSPEVIGAPAAALHEPLAAFAPGVSAEYALGRDGSCVITFTADGCEEVFENVFALVDAAPILPGFVFQALRPRSAPQRFEAFGVGFDLADLRFYYRLGSDKIVVVILADECPPCDYRTRRAYASALVSRLLGEEDFGRYVVDALLIEYETWLSATPGGRSAPAAVLAPTFDRVFRRPLPARRRDAQYGRLRLVS